MLKHLGRGLLLLQCDPFCTLWVRESQKLRTTVKSRTLKPSWNERFNFMVHSSQHQQLTIDLYDAGEVSGWFGKCGIRCFSSFAQHLFCV